MDGARLEVVLEPHPDGFGPNGAETVELLVATNPGMPTSPLKDAASGGELSRIMLALSGLGSGDGERTLVFDEIDAGIGGNTARAVGERLRGARARAARCSASPTCRRSRRWPRPTSGSRSATRRRRDAGDGRAGRRRRAGRRDRPDARRRARRRGGQPPRTRAAQGRLSGARRACGRHADFRIIGAWLCAAGRARCCAGPRSSCGPTEVAADRRPRAARPQDQEPGQAPRPGRHRGDRPRRPRPDRGRGPRGERRRRRSSTSRRRRPTATRTAGPLILARAGVPLVDAPAAPLFEELSDGDEIVAARRRGARQRGRARDRRR